MKPNTNTFNLLPSQQILPKFLLECAVLLNIDGSTGSGFIIVHEEDVFLVTAKHVLFDADNSIIGKTLFISAPVLATRSSFDDAKEIRFEIDLDTVLTSYSKQFDVCIIYLSKIIARSEDGTELQVNHQKGVIILSDEAINPKVLSIGQIGLISQVLISNDVFLIGYPTSLGLKKMGQFNFNFPLLRKGIVSGIDISKNTIILDCSVFPGNSGAPVFQKQGLVSDDFVVIGVVSRFIPYVQTWVNVRDKIEHIEYQNSGYSVITSMDAVFDLIKDSAHLFNNNQK